MLPQTCKAYEAVVATAETVGRLQPDEALHIGALCRHCGVTERRLRAAFRAVCGTTPYRHLRRLRLREARLALQSPRAGTTVTLIAMQFGFLELGRFSVEYRSVFGERPSDTLRRSASPGIERHRYTIESAPAALQAT